MAEKLCIARAYNDEPIRRFVVGVYRKLVYISAVSPEDSLGIGSKGAVGFPRDCIYEYEKSLFDGLCVAYRAGDVDNLGKLWGQLTKIPKPGLDTWLKQST